MKSVHAKKGRTPASRPQEAAPAGDGGRTIQFVYSGPAKAVTVAGEFNGWDLASHPLKRGSDGVWTGSVTLAPGRYEYQLVVDGAWVLDQRCPETTENPFGTRNCVLTVA